MNTTLAPHNLKALSPHSCRWMAFVDGENFAIRAKDVLQLAKVEAPPKRYYEPDVFLWFPMHKGLQPLVGLGAGAFDLAQQAIRAHYYASVRGDAERVNEVRARLRTLQFHPEVFKKDHPDRKAKGVDIALSKDLLSHAFNDSYDVAVLFAGDGDYVPLLQELKRLGRRICVAFFREFGFNRELELQADAFFDVTHLLLSAVNGYAHSLRPSPGPHHAQCDACSRIERYDATLVGLDGIPTEWSRLVLKGVTLSLCAYCCDRCAQSPESDPLVRSIPRLRDLLMED